MKKEEQCEIKGKFGYFMMPQLIPFSQRFLIGKNFNKSYVKLSSMSMDKPDVQLLSLFLQKNTWWTTPSLPSAHSLPSDRSAIMNRLLSFVREKLKSNSNSSAQLLLIHLAEGCQARCCSLLKRSHHLHAPRSPFHYLGLLLNLLKATNYSRSLRDDLPLQRLSPPPW